MTKAERLQLRELLNKFIYGYKPERSYLGTGATNDRGKFCVRSPSQGSLNDGYSFTSTSILSMSIV